MSTAHSARKLPDPNAKKQRVRFISSKVQPVYRPRRSRCETVNTTARKTGGRKEEFSEDLMAPTPRKVTVHCTKLPVAEVRPPRSRTQAVKHDAPILGDSPQPQVTSLRKKILDCQKQAQSDWKPRHPRTQNPGSEIIAKLARVPVTAEVPKERSRIQRERPTKSSSTPVQNGTSSCEVAARSLKPTCVPPRSSYPRKTGSRAPCPRPTRERPVSSCAAPANRYDEYI